MNQARFHDTPINRVIVILQILSEPTISIHLPTVKSINDKVHSSDFELPNSIFEKGGLKELNQGKSYLINGITHSVVKAVKR